MRLEETQQPAALRSGEHRNSRSFFLNGEGIVRALLFVLPAAFLFLHLGDFPFLPTSAYTDLLVSHYPNGLLIQQSITRWHTIPLWSPAILSGYPFAADPLSGLYYLPGLLALLFPLPLGFTLIIIAHIVWAGVGLYTLLRAEGLSSVAAMFSGLAFAALPKLYSHLGAGHLTLLYAVAWTPWLLLAEKNARPILVAERGRGTRFLLPGLVLGIIALADIRWAAYAGILWLAYGLRLSLPFRPILPGLARWLAQTAAGVLFAVLVAAPLLLPLVEYTRLTTRAAMTPADNLSFSLPLTGLLGLVYPGFPGTAESVLYPGAVVAVLAVMVLTLPALRRRSRFWLAAVGVTLLYALGTNLPLGDLIAQLPGLSLLRVPARALFITGMALCVAAGYAVEYLHVMVERSHKQGNGETLSARSGLVFFGVTTFVVLFGVMAVAAVQKPIGRFLFGWGALFALVAAALIGLARARRIGPRALTVLLFSACLVDTISINALLLEFKPAARVFSAGQPVIQTIQKMASERDAGLVPFRVYSPSYSIEQHVAAPGGLELADGVDPLQLAAYVDFMTGPGGATGVPSSGYSVTLPPHPGTDPSTDTRGFVPDPAKLGLLNVRYVVTQFPIEAPGLDLLSTVGETRIYANTLALPRAWIQSPDAAMGQQVRSGAQVTMQPNRAEVAAEGPGLLVLSELAYPGWHAAVDGVSVPVETVGGLLRGVQLAPGAHQVVLDFRPLPVYAGLAIGALAWLVFIVFFILDRKSRHA